MNILKAIELFSLNGLIVCYVNYNQNKVVILKKKSIFYISVENGGNKLDVREAMRIIVCFFLMRK